MVSKVAALTVSLQYKNFQNRNSSISTVGDIKVDGWKISNSYVTGLMENVSNHTMEITR